MKTHNLTQGSPEWLAYRAGHFNASDAPAMLGCSPHKTRTELMHELHTGLTPEVDAATQRRFDDGHRFEALARPLAEAIIGEELYPVVGSDDGLSASFDGLTMSGAVAWEHKTLNAELRDAMFDGCTGKDLPKKYQVQMEHQLWVSGAGSCLFMASKWDGDELIEERNCWYLANLTLRNEIYKGWRQFEIDLATYVPAPVVVAAVGHTPETLPALLIEVTGMVTHSNLEVYKEHALGVFVRINRVLETNQQFADAEKVVKWCGDVESRLAAAKQHALSQTADIEALFRAIDDISAESKRTRLELEKLIKARKEQMRFELVTHGATELAKHIDALNQRLGKPYLPPVTAITADFAGAIKGKRTIESMQNAVSTALAQAKIDANATADRIQLNLATIGTYPAFDFLFADVAQLVQKDSEFVAITIKNRISEHQAKEAARIEAERLRIASEERAKAEAAERVRADSEIAIATAKARTEAHAQVQAEHQAKEATVEVIAKAAQVEEPVVHIAIPAPSGAPTLRLGQIGERLGFSLTADFLSRLGFDPAATDKAAKLYHEADFARICAALVKHISFVGELQTA